MIVPTSLERIRPFPVLAISILNRLPLSAEATWEVRDLLQEQEQLNAEIAAVAQKRGMDGDLSTMTNLELTEIALTLLVSGYMRASRVYSATLQASEHSKYWRYTMASATACGELGPARGLNPVLTYAAGLLHDIGRLALMTAFPEKYANLLTLANRMLAAGEPFELPEYERTLFGLNRFETARWLSDTWDLPAPIRLIVGRFEQQAPPSETMLITAVRDGTRLAHALGYGYLETAPQTRRADLAQLLSLKDYRGRFTAIAMSKMIDERLECYPIEKSIL